MALLECENLSVRFATLDGDVSVVNNINLTIDEGECFGVVGESGSGKSQTFMAIMALLAENGHATGSVKFKGREILNAPRRLMNELRGDQIAVIFQDPMSSLTPFLRIGDQMCEGLIQHKGMSQAKAKERVLETLEMVRIPAVRRRYQQYPHELSGGMRQRVMIAQALLCKPALLIADEPTTALDVTVQAEVLEIFNGLKEHTDMAIVMITHDLGVIAGLCDKVAVMYSGRIVESGVVDDIFYRPHHPYTAGLLRSIPTLTMDVDQDLAVIPGRPPNMHAVPAGCHFRPRCASAFATCFETLPALKTLAPNHVSACHLGTLVGDVA